MTTKKNTVINSSILIISVSWIVKTLGLLSTIILARLLTPSDFGLVAMVMLVIYFFNIFSETGSKQYILSLTHVENTELNTAWTLNLLSKLIISIALLIVAPYCASFFSAPKLTNALFAAAFIPFINGLENPAIYLVKRDLNYSGIFKLNLFTKIVSFAVTIYLAFYLKSHWALIVGTIFHFALMTIGSYIVIPYKPSFSLQNIRPQWDYSKWLFVRGLVGYARAKFDSFILAKSFLTYELGLFNVAKEFAMLLYEQVAMPLADIVMTSVQKAGNNKAEIRTVVEKFSTLLACFLIPSMVGISILSNQIVVVILGEPWIKAGPLLSALSILGFTSSLVVIMSSTLNSLSKTKVAFKLDFIATIIILVALVLSRDFDINTFALIRGWLGFIVLIGYLIILRQIIKLSISKYILNMIPAILASAGMALILFATIYKYPEISILTLIIHIVIGVTSYSVIFGLLIKLLHRKSESLNYLYKLILKAYKQRLLNL